MVSKKKLQSHFNIFLLSILILIILLIFFRFLRNILEAGSRQHNIAFMNPESVSIDGFRQKERVNNVVDRMLQLETMQSLFIPWNSGYAFLIF